VSRKSEKTTDCVHVIGHFYGLKRLILINEREELVQYFKAYSTSIFKPVGKKVEKVVQFFDNRRGYGDWFKYCPRCGEKLDWSRIKQNFGTK